MWAIDFEYDGQTLSDYGMIVCSFDDTSGMTTATAGSTITFNKVSKNGGRNYYIINTSYDECLETTFDICKDSEVYDREHIYISDDEYRDLMRWLNRKEFLQFRICDSDYMENDTCYYNASFNVERILINDRLCGLRLTLITDKPFGYGTDSVSTFNVSNTYISYLVSDLSDEIGFTYPTIEVVCNESGNLTITTDLYPTTCTIKNCVMGEKITINGDTLTVTSSSTTHDIADDFNYIFPKIGNTYSNRANHLTFNIACTVTVSYKPIIKSSI